MITKMASNLFIIIAEHDCKINDSELGTGHYPDEAQDWDSDCSASSLLLQNKCVACVSKAPCLETNSKMIVWPDNYMSLVCRIFLEGS